jgi:hypothetical protein
MSNSPLPMGNVYGSAATVISPDGGLTAGSSAARVRTRNKSYGEAKRAWRVAFCPPLSDKAAHSATKRTPGLRMPAGSKLCLIRCMSSTLAGSSSFR